MTPAENPAPTPEEIEREKRYRYAEGCGLGYNANRAQQAVDAWEKSLTEKPNQTP